MSEGKAVTLAGIGTVVLSAGSWLAVVLLSGDGELAAAAMLIGLGIGVDQMSRIGMRYDRR
ncbi:MAG TPA: hypothetical protein VFT79_05655 [Solirubrobacterales bacterium]|nr:hypothetical protein [Solirubrobacterales bacterium]